MTTREDVLGPGRIEQIPKPPPPPVLAVEVVYALLATRTFDLVAFYAGVPEAERAAYWETDISEWGYEDEAERPLAYLLMCDQPEVTFGVRRGLMRNGFTGVDVERVCLTHRNRVRLRDRIEKMWTVADAALLAEHVPWLNRAAPPSPEDLARIPGPLDHPLF